MTGIDGQPSRILDVVRNSKILRDIPSKPYQEFGSFIQARDGLRHYPFRDYNQVQRDIPRVSAVDVGVGAQYRNRNLGEENKRFFRSILPTYGGSPFIVDLWDWIDEIEDYFDETQPPERLKCKIASYTLVEEAERWWCQLEHHRFSWWRMKHLVAAQFIPRRCSMKGPLKVHSKISSIEECKHSSSYGLYHTTCISGMEGTTEAEIPTGHIEEPKNINLYEVSVKEKSEENVVLKSVNCSIKDPTESYSDEHVVKEIQPSGFEHFNLRHEDTNSVDDQINAKSHAITKMPSKEMMEATMSTGNILIQISEKKNMEDKGKEESEDGKRAESTFGEKTNIGLVEELRKYTQNIPMPRSIGHHVNEVSEDKKDSLSVQDCDEQETPDIEAVKVKLDLKVTFMHKGQLPIVAFVLPEPSKAFWESIYETNNKKLKLSHVILGLHLDDYEHMMSLIFGECMIAGYAIDEIGLPSFDPGGSPVFQKAGNYLFPSYGILLKNEATNDRISLNIARLKGKSEANEPTVAVKEVVVTSVNCSTKCFFTVHNCGQSEKCGCNCLRVQQHCGAYEETGAAPIKKEAQAKVEAMGYLVEASELINKSATKGESTDHMERANLHTRTEVTDMYVIKYLLELSLYHEPYVEVNENSILLEERRLVDLASTTTVQVIEQGQTLALYEKARPIDSFVGGVVVLMFDPGGCWSNKQFQDQMAFLFGFCFGIRNDLLYVQKKDISDLILLKWERGLDILTTKRTLACVVFIRYIPPMWRLVCVITYFQGAARVFPGAAWAGVASNLLRSILTSQLVDAFWYLLLLEHVNASWESSSQNFIERITGLCEFDIHYYVWFAMENAHCEWVGEYKSKLKYSSTLRFISSFGITKMNNEDELFTQGLAYVQEVEPGIFFGCYDEFSCWSLLERRATHHRIRVHNELGCKWDQHRGECRRRSACHLVCFTWDKCDSYLQQGNQGLKNVAKAKLCYGPLVVNLVDMIWFAKDQQQIMAVYLVYDVADVYHSYLTHGHPFITPLANKPPRFNITRGRAIPCEGWKETINGYNEYIGGYLGFKIKDVAVCSYLGAIWMSGRRLRAAKLFYKLVSGLDPPMGFDGACTTSTWILKSSLEDELFEEVDGADVAN